jgi:trans-2,3-dihydro-3-hydroxyanthranilate isomerase
MREVWLVDAFSNQSFMGNPAGVVPDATGLSLQQMQDIANELHASETAFLLPPSRPDLADLRVRFFTPLNEVDLCGHATIGSIGALFLENRMPATTRNHLRLETDVGVLPIRISQVGPQSSVFVEMRQASPKFQSYQIPWNIYAEVLGIQASDFDTSLPAGLASTGLWDLFLPVKSREVMERITPNFMQLAHLNREHGVISTHVYTYDVQEQGHHFHARDFSPAVGVPEDPATGTATGALLALLTKHGVCRVGNTYIFEQGYEIKRNSLIHARMEQNADGNAVFVGGTAILTMKGYFQ